jgi:tetratricopeptide (TPR) repeat protein
MYAVRLCTVALLVAGSLRAQTAAEQDLAAAYKLLLQKDYDSAITAFDRALAVQPKKAAIHKVLAYTLLKAGQNAEARDQFEKALLLNPHDDTAALEYAFLCYDTRKPIEARRTFDRLRTHGLTGSTRASAQKAFENIDAPLRDGIARWQHALAILPNPLAPTTYSAHWELAQLAERRDELQLAAEQYEICRRLKPRLDSLLIDLARVWRQLNDSESAHAALLAASRCSEPRTAETALELLGPRYPYVYEFQNAIKLDPQNIPLRRELAYLLLALHKEPEAIVEFEKILEIDPHDQLSANQLSALRHPLKSEVHAQSPNPSDARIDPKTMGRKSLAAGYIHDAIRYFLIAHETNPDDSGVMLQLGWAYNLEKNDKEAIQWFDAARHSSNAAVATEANRAWHNLRGDSASQTTTWALPMYSSRWKDAFVYGQMKHDLPFFSSAPVHLYLSTRFIGDARGQVSLGNLGPQYLSESEFIIGGGVSTKSWHHLLGWAEAGEAVKYLPGRQDVGAAVPDYRGGLNFAKGFGSLLGSHSPGLFYETTGDAVYVSRFDKDWLFYSQHRIGRTFHALGGNYIQLYANSNYVRDVKSQYWANSIEFGPGAKVHLPWLPPNVYFAADWLRGVYTNNKGNPRGPNYTDLRLSFWYAVSR